MQRDRLNLMIDMLNEIDQKAWFPDGSHARMRFNMAVWATGEPRPDPECGAVACAIGHAMYDARFPGLEPSIARVPQYRTLIAWEAVAAYFDISIADALYLFNVEHYDSDLPTPANVVDRIADYLAMPTKEA